VGGEGGGGRGRGGGCGSEEGKKKHGVVWGRCRSRKYKKPSEDEVWEGGGGSEGGQLGTAVERMRENMVCEGGAKTERE
jgi:hypothetical protein